jgi:hypothetical protein
VLLFFVAGCGDSDYDFRPEATGPEAEITVVIDSNSWNGPIGEALRNELGKYVATLPTPEQAFDIRQASITSQKEFDRLKAFKNIVVAAPLSDTTNEAKFLKSILSEEAQQAIAGGGSAVVPREDVWRRRQQVVYVTASTPADLVTTIETDGAGIRSRFDVATRERLYREMFERGRQPDIEAKLMEEHGFAVNAQHDYLIAIDTTNFVWLRRILSDTWRSLFVYYEENGNPADLTPEWVYNTRDSLAQRYLQGNLGGWIEVDRRRPLETEEVNFLDRYALETRGLWHMVGREDGEKVMLGMGGPFLTYAFYDEPSGRLYLIDGMVFAPSFKKREFLRQMEVIAFTFRTRQEEAAKAQLAENE